MVEAPRYGVHSPRFFTLLSRVREGPPPEEWLREAKEEVNKVKAPRKWVETAWGWRLVR